MKNLIFIISLVVFSTTLFAQETSDSTTSVAKKSFTQFSASAHTGVGPLTKGNTFTLAFSGKKSYLSFGVNNALGEIIYLHSLNKNFSVGFSGGYLNNTLWAGPIATTSWFGGHLNTLHWAGWSHGNTEEGNTEIMPMFCFSYQQASLNIYGFEALYANQIYQELPAEHIFNLKKTFKIKTRKLPGDFTCFFSGGYMLNSEKFLWSSGLSWAFTKEEK